MRCIRMVEKSQDVYAITDLFRLKANDAKVIFKIIRGSWIKDFS